MTERIIELVLQESLWFPVAVVLSLSAVAAFLIRQRRRQASHRLKTLCALNLSYGCMLGITGGGHILAVTLKAAQGTLEGSATLLYALGFGITIPALWLAISVPRLLQDEKSTRRRVTVLNIWLVILLLAAGLPNWPLAAPGGLNILYRFHSGAATGIVIVAVSVVGYLALFVGSLVFLASGGTFEQFQGID